MALPRLLAEDGLYRAARSKNWCNQDNSVNGAAFHRRVPELNDQGNRKAYDAAGLSIGFEESQTVTQFAAAMREIPVTCHAVIGIKIADVTSVSCHVHAPNENHGNIKNVPFKRTTALMTDEEKAEVDEARAIYVELELAKKATVLPQSD